MPTKATTTTMPETTNMLLPLGGIKKENLTGATQVFAQPNTWQPIKFANVQAINKAPDFGFFIEKSALATAGWYGLPHGGIEKPIKFGTVNPVMKDGILFHKVNMIMVDQSPRFIEVTDKGAEACAQALAEKEAGRPYDPHLLRLEKANALVDIYCDQSDSTVDDYGNPYGGSVLYGHLKDTYGHTDYTTMRTMYLIFLLDDKYEFLHSTPVVLTLRGLAAVQFADAVKQFGKAVLGEVANSDRKYRKLNNAKASVAGLRNFYFSVELEGGSAGSRGNWVTKIKEVDNGILAIGGDFIADESIREKVLDCAEVNDGFSYRFAKQISTDFDGYNQMSSAVEQALLPSTKLDGLTTDADVLF